MSVGSVPWFVAAIVADLLLGALVIWHIYGPLHPSRRRTICFSIGVLLAVPLLCVTVIGWLAHQ